MINAKAIFFLVGEINKGEYSFFILQTEKRHSHAADLYENQAHSPAGAVHVLAHGDLHDGGVPLQHRGQLLCGKDQRGRHDGTFSGLSHPEPDQRGHHRLLHRCKRRDLLSSGRPGPAPGQPRRGPEHRIQRGPRYPFDRGVHRRRAVFPGSFYERRPGHQPGRPILPHRLLFCGIYCGLHVYGKDLSGRRKDAHDHALHDVRLRGQHHPGPHFDLRLGAFPPDGRPWPQVSDRSSAWPSM